MSTGLEDLGLPEEGDNRQVWLLPPCIFGHSNNYMVYLISTPQLCRNINTLEDKSDSLGLLVVTAI